MKRTTTANNSRRPVSAIALGLTLAAANLIATRPTEYSFEAYKLYYRLMWDELPGRTWTLQGKKTPFDADTAHRFFRVIVTPQ